MSYTFHSREAQAMKSNMPRIAVTIAFLLGFVWLLLQIAPPRRPLYGGVFTMYHETLPNIYTDARLAVQRTYFGDKRERGMIAKGHISSGTLLQRIPRDSLICVSDAISSIPVKSFATSFATHAYFPPSTLLTDQWLLTVWYLSEKSLGSKSAFYPYVRTYPYEYAGAFSWKDTDWEPLRDSSYGIYGRTVLHEWDVRWNVVSSHFAAHPALYPPRYFSRDVFRQAFSQIMTRTFSLPLEEGDTFPPSTCLVPLAEMYNRDSSSRNKLEMVRNEEGRVEYFEIRATSDVAPGGAVTLEPLPLSNRELLFKHGYVLSSNYYDSIDIVIDHLSPEAAELASLQAGSEWRASLSIHSLAAKTIDPPVLSLLRAQFVSATEQTAQIPISIQRAKRGDMVSLENERRVLALLYETALRVSIIRSEELDEIVAVFVQQQRPGEESLAQAVGALGHGELLAAQALERYIRAQSDVVGWGESGEGEEGVDMPGFLLEVRDRFMEQWGTRFRTWRGGDYGDEDDDQGEAEMMKEL